MNSDKGSLDILAYAAAAATSPAPSSIKPTFLAENANTTSASPVGDHATSCRPPDRTYSSNHFNSEGSKLCGAGSIIDTFLSASDVARRRDLRKKMKNKGSQHHLVQKKESNRCEKKSKESSKSRRSDMPNRNEFFGTKSQFASDDNVDREISFEMIVGSSTVSVAGSAFFHSSIGMDREIHHDNKPNVNAQNQVKENWPYTRKTPSEDMSDELGAVKHEKETAYVLRKYVDRSRESDHLPNVPLTTPNRSPSFIVKLYAVLSYHPELSRIITWLSHGRAWTIVDPVEFEVSVLPKHFGSGISLATFSKRALNIWGFQRLNTESGSSARPIYYHESFLRGIPHLMKTMAPDSGKTGAPKLSKSGHVSETDLNSINQLHPLPEVCNADTQEESNIVMQLIDKFIVEKGYNARVPVSLCHRQSLGRGRAKKFLKSNFKNDPDEEKTTGCKRGYAGSENDENVKKLKKSTAVGNRGIAESNLKGQHESNIGSDRHSGSDYDCRNSPSKFPPQSTANMVSFPNGIALGDICALVESANPSLYSLYCKNTKPLSSETSVASCSKSKLSCNPGGFPSRQDNFVGNSASRDQESSKSTPLNKVPFTLAAGISDTKSDSLLDPQLEHIQVASNMMRNTQLSHPQPTTLPIDANNDYTNRNKLPQSNIDELRHKPHDSMKDLLRKMKTKEPVLNSSRSNSSTKNEYSASSKSTPLSSGTGKAESAKNMQFHPSIMTFFKEDVRPGCPQFIPNPMYLNFYVGSKEAQNAENNKLHEACSTNPIQKMSASQDSLDRCSCQKSSSFQQVAKRNLEISSQCDLQQNQANISTAIMNMIEQIRVTSASLKKSNCVNDASTSLNTAASHPTEAGNNQQSRSSNNYRKNRSEDILRSVITRAFLAGIVMGSKSVTSENNENARSITDSR